MALSAAETTPKYLDALDLTGKVYLVFGAGQGIGRQCAYALAQCGARVVAVGRGAAATMQIANEVKGRGVCADITDRIAVERIVKGVYATEGRLDGLINTIGLPINKGVLSLTDDDWRAQYEGILHHAHLTLQIGGGAMAERGGGSIIFVTTIAAERAFKGPVANATLRAGVHHLVRLAAVELGPRNVRVNAVAPGLTLTPRMRSFLDDDRLAQTVERYPLRRVAEPSDIASAALFLVSGLAHCVTGQVITVDGGVSLASAAPV